MRTGGRTCFRTPDSKNDSQGGGWRTQEWCHGNALNEHVLVEPSTVSYNPIVASPDLKRVHRPREGDRAAYGYARARGGELVPPGLGGCGMRCTGAWAARGTRKGGHERSAVPRSGHRVVAKGSLTGDYRGSSTRTDDAPKMSSRERGRPRCPYVKRAGCRKSSTSGYHLRSKNRIS